MARRFKLVRIVNADGPPDKDELIIDFLDLHAQKNLLIDQQVAMKKAGREAESEELGGLVGLLDGLQDVGSHLGVPDAECYPGSENPD